VLLLPFRVVGIAVGGALSLAWAIVTLPARLLRGLREKRQLSALDASQNQSRTAVS
jgi:hypothetical protein